MSDPIVVESPANADAWPVTPPPAAGRKPTASERADAALEGVQALAARLEEVAAGIPSVSPDGTASALTADQAAALAKVPGLDQDLDALGGVVNTIAENVSKVADDVAALNRRSDGAADVAAYEKLREDIRATLAEIRTDRREPGDADRARFDELARELQASREHHDALARTVDALADRAHVAANGQALAPRETSAPLVFAAVHRLMCRVPELGKTGSAPQSAGGFKFRGIEAVMDAIGSAMREPAIGLILRTEIVRCDVTRETVNGRTWTSTDLITRFVFVHPEDGSEHAFEMAGEGRDLGDKASSKAASMAAKYALCQALMIPFNGMADSDQEDPATQQAQEWERNQERERQQAQAYEREQQQNRQRTQRSAAAPATTSDEPPWDETPARPQAQAPADPWSSAPSAAYEQAGPSHPIVKAERAAAAVAALDKLSTLNLADARARWEKISAQVQDEGLAGEMVSGSNVTLHLEMHRQLLLRAANG
jgi:hypothetical protein